MSASREFLRLSRRVTVFEGESDATMSVDERYISEGILHPSHSLSTSSQVEYHCLSVSENRELRLSCCQLKKTEEGSSNESE